MLMVLIKGAALGLAFNLLFMVWRRAAQQWTAWFPVLKKAAEIVLWVAAIALVIVGLNLLGEAGDVMLFLGGSMLGYAMLPLLFLIRRVRGGEERHERGSRVASAAEVTKMVKRSREERDIQIGNIPIPKSAEPYHFLISGSTGSGKSVAIRTLIEALRRRGDTALVVDSGGEFLSQFWKDGSDAILNPFDERSVAWSPTAELEGPWDAEALARSIIPDGTGENKEWNSYAQTLLTSCMQALWQQGRTGLRDLLYAVQVAPRSELAQLLASTPAAAQLSSEKTFGSIRTIASNYLSSYNYLDEAQKAFSVSEFVKTSKGGFLYLTYRDDQLDSLRNLISCVLDIAARTILSLPPDPRRRIWLIVDEFASIGRVQSIEAVATKARKVGGCLVIGLQSVAQLKARYGEHNAQTILSCLSNTLILRNVDADTAEYMSKFIGDAQVVRTAEGASSSDSTGGTRSWTEQTTTQRVVMASQIQQLPNLAGFLKIAGHYPLCYVTLALPAKRAASVAPYVARDFKAKPMIRLQTAPVPGASEPGAATGPSPAPPANVRRIILNRRPE